MSAAALTWAWRQMPALTSTPAKLVLVALADRADDDGDLFPKVEWVAEKVQLGKSTVRRHIAALEETGLLVREERTRPTDGRQTSNLLRLALGTEWAPSSERPGRPELGGSPRPELGGQETTSKETTNRDIPERDARAAEVHAFFVERKGGGRPLSSGTEKLIVRALNAGFTVPDLKLAVSGLLGSDWHREHGQQTLSVIFKTGPGTSSFEDRIQEFIDRGMSRSSHQPSNGHVEVPDWVKRQLRLYGERGHQNPQVASMGQDAMDWLASAGLEAVWSLPAPPCELRDIRKADA